LSLGQTTIFGTLNGSLSFAKPTPPRPGPRPKPTGQSDSVLGRRIVGGQNEKQIVELFATVRLSQNNEAEPGDEDIVNGRVVIDDDSESEADEYEYIPKRRYAYSREHKLAAIDYFQTTWRKKKDNTFEHISTRCAARKLKISRKMLRSWVSNKAKIMA
jgi:hypothetical protein